MKIIIGLQKLQYETCMWRKKKNKKTLIKTQITAIYLRQTGSDITAQISWLSLHSDFSMIWSSHLQSSQKNQTVNPAFDNTQQGSKCSTAVMV